jgi:hypothetical protein
MREFHKSPAKNRWLCGGNRSGKSEGNIGYDLCSFALGVHPYRRTPKNATIWAGVQQTRIKGYVAAFAGAVYKTFSRDTHVIKPFKIPNDWTRYRAIDWGFNNPFVCLWLAREPDRRWYV